MGEKMKFKAWASPEAKASLSEITISAPQSLSPNDVLVQVEYCGICHSDIHLIDNDWGVSSYPLVPGHEIVGRVRAVGDLVTHLKVGDGVGIGWQSGSCMNCDYCNSSRENLCSQSKATCVGHNGGFAEYHVTDSRFVFNIPDKIYGPDAAPLLCGGATVFSALCEFMPKQQSWSGHVGVVGVGGLGHLAIKFANKMGYEVTVFSSSQSKKAELMAIGAHHFYSSTDESEILNAARTLDLVLVTVPFDLPWDAYLRALRPDGTLSFVGVPPKPLSLHVRSLLGGRLRVAGSPIAGRARINEMLTFAARHNITSESEVFHVAAVNDAIMRTRSGKARYRTVLKMAKDE